MPRKQIVGRCHRPYWEKDLYEAKRLAAMPEETHWRIRTIRRLRRDDNPLEAAMARILRELGVRFERQACFTRYFVDFWLPQHRVAVETDGKAHLVPRQMAHDARRDRFLTSQGVKVRRYPSAQVFHAPSSVKDDLKRLLGLHVAPAPATRP